MKPKVHVGYIDGLRAVAVLAVLMYHAIIANDASYPDVVYCGSRGVNLFFVISGFCLAFPFLGAWRSGRLLGLNYAGYGMFLARRFSRIAPPFYVALSLLAFLAFTPFGFPNAAHQDTSAPNAIHDFIANLFFATAKHPLLNGSFWTLGIEARWYLLCPLLVALYVRSRYAFAAVGLGLYALYFFSPYSIADEGMLPCFMLGVAAADLAIVEHPWRRFAPYLAVPALALAIFDQSRTVSTDLGNPLWHAASFFLVVAGGYGPFARAFSWRPIASIGIASYSIYLVHGPFIESLIKTGFPRPVAALCGLAIGAAFYRVVEKPLASKRVRSAIEGALARPFRMLPLPQRTPREVEAA